MRARKPLDHRLDSLINFRFKECAPLLYSTYDPLGTIERHHGSSISTAKTPGIEGLPFYSSTLNPGDADDLCRVDFIILEVLFENVGWLAKLKIVR